LPNPNRRRRSSRARHVAVLVEVGDVVQVHAHAPVLRSGDVAGRLLERAERAAEDELLVVVYRLIVEDQHGEFVHAGMDGFDLLGRERLPQVEARDDTREERAIDRIDRFDVHGPILPCRPLLGERRPFAKQPSAVLVEMLVEHLGGLDALDPEVPVVGPQLAPGADQA
jgi:hypothetical protein